MSALEAIKRRITAASPDIKLRYVQEIVDRFFDDDSVDQSNLTWVISNADAHHNLLHGKQTGELNKAGEVYRKALPLLKASFVFQAQPLSFSDFWQDAGHADMGYAMDDWENVIKTRVRTAVFSVVQMSLYWYSTKDGGKAGHLEEFDETPHLVGRMVGEMLKMSDEEYKKTLEDATHPTIGMIRKSLEIDNTWADDNGMFGPIPFGTSTRGIVTDLKPFLDALRPMREFLPGNISQTGK